MKKLTLHVSALAVLFSAPLAGQIPAGLVERLEASNPLETLLASAPETPQARLDSWQRALLEFTEDHPVLTEEQLLVVLDAVDLVHIGDFEDESALGLKSLRTSLDAIRGALTTDELISLLGRFEGLQGWLYQNGLIEGLVVEASFGETCNCNQNGDCAGVTCQSVSCTSGPGSRAWGICGGLF